MEDLFESAIRAPQDQPRSILKKTSHQPTPAVPPNVNIPAPPTDQAARNLQTALSYAHQIQAQKALQNDILEHIESLSLLPNDDPASAPDIEAFKSAVAIFQPSDYSALLEERNVNGFCGYTLCANSPLPPRKGRQWMQGKVEHRFCGTDCARKAMYVRAQLDETPAWERRGGYGTAIILKDEVSSHSHSQHPPTDVEAATEQSQLAHERGEQVDSRRVKLVTDNVVEKKTSSSGNLEHGVTFGDLAHESIDGYRIPSERYRPRQADVHGD